jgi:cysteine desulfurase / selenocysteine lyase
MEGGTPNVFGLAGLREGVRILQERGVDAILQHEQKLMTVFWCALKDPSRFRWYGADRLIRDRKGDGRVGLVSLNLPGFTPAEWAAILDEQFDIAVRAGLHCAPYAHRHLGTYPLGTMRISVGCDTTEADMQEAAAAMENIAEA